MTYYRLIKNEKHLLLDEDTEGLRAKINANNMSMRLSAEAAVQLLNQMPSTGKFYYNLFFQLGCLPDGMTKDHLV